VYNGRKIKLAILIMRYFLLFLLTVISISCNRTKQVDFMHQSDCDVYTDEVKSEPISHGHVEYIDMINASSCAKEQLKNVYLLYYDSIQITVFKQHPKVNFKLIQSLIKIYQTDTTRLSQFVRTDSSVRITVSRLCKNQTDKNYYNEYFDWRDIEYSTSTKPFVKTKNILLTTWYKWGN
jgi:hypothetical protein